MLISAGIPPFRRDRNSSGPLIIAGGVSVSMNPEVLGDFLDLVFIGEIVGDIDEPNGFWGTIANCYRSNKVFGIVTKFAKISQMFQVFMSPKPTNLNIGMTGL